MPTYDYQCHICQKVEEHIHAISENPEYKCPDCGTIMPKIFTLNTTGFVLKGGTPAIHYKEKRNRLKRNQELKNKQQKKRGPSVKPNIAGVETRTWSDAQKMAKEAGLNHESYKPWVEKEKNKKIIV